MMDTFFRRQPPRTTAGTGAGAAPAPRAEPHRAAPIPGAGPAGAPTTTMEAAPSDEENEDEAAPVDAAKELPSWARSARKQRHLLTIYPWLQVDNDGPRCKVGLGRLALIIAFFYCLNCLELIDFL